MNNHLITKGNNLIEARYQYPLTAREQKIILTMVSQIQPDDEDFSDYSISVHDFHEMLGLEGREKYTELKKILKTLTSKVIEIPTEDGYVITSWLASAEYKNGEGIMLLTFSPKLKPYLLQLKKAFTSYRLNNILSLKSAYSIRLYELLKKWQYLNKWECSIENLKEKFGIEQDKYKLYGHFKARVVEPAVKELNEKTDIQISYKEIRKGRKVVKIEFSIRQQLANNTEKIENIPPSISKPEPGELEKNPVVKMQHVLNIQAEGFTISQSVCHDLLDKSSAIWGDKAEESMQMLVQQVSRTKGIVNKVGYLRAIINKSHEQYLNGVDIPIPYSDTVSSSLPKWFTNTGIDERQDQLSLDDDPDFLEEKEKLEAVLKMRKES
ncbi:replication initiation protein [Domibacillus sp. A3M-37]|uniref:replication initiation protein n=1 Tax=Domibacillus sp. A3M-37 TaxID=2962037 RepID=UPI0020B82C2D|nr:replication initiation protein [Domibacillus sp. A3M-37]MCP3764687.1 replication initiation protein [Domibacillus sp. A3M-37]